MWLSVLTGSCSFHLPLVIVFFGKTFWIWNDLLADCADLSVQREVVDSVHSVALCEQPVGGRSSAVNARILPFTLSPPQEGRKAMFCVGEHGVCFALGCSLCALPLGNDAVS